MLKQYVHGLFIFICAAAILLLSACKGAAVPKPHSASVHEKTQSRSPAHATQSQKSGIGTQQGGSRQGVTLNLRNNVSTLAGKVGMAGATDGVNAQADFDSPKGITTDGSSLYLADSNNHTIRKIDIATGMVTTLAGLAGKKGSSDGRGTNARFNRPFAITTDGNSLYVTDSNNHTIRQIEIETGVVTTIAGGVGEVGYVDGIAKRARFFIPEGITVVGNYLYVSDTHNHSVRKISLESRMVTTIAGMSGAPGFFDDAGSKARFSYPKGITSDGQQLYLADFGNSQIRKISIRNGIVNTLSGTVMKQVNAEEQVEVAQFNYPSGITTDGRNLYVADTFNRSIRKIVISTGFVTTIAGAEEKEGSVDGIGTEAHFKDPVGITTDGSSIFVTDSSDHLVRKIR
jgi:sugar lactone lactonase YvrE